MSNVSNVKDQFKEVNPTHSELLKFHLRVTNKADDEVALRDAKKKIATLTNPPTHQPHQHAQISHNEQQTVVNENNKQAEKLAKKQQAAIANDSKKAKEEKPKAAEEFKHLSTEEFEKVKKQAEQQVTNASNRKEKSETSVQTASVKPPWEQ